MTANLNAIEFIRSEYCSPNPSAQSVEIFTDKAVFNDGLDEKYQFLASAKLLQFPVNENLTYYFVVASIHDEETGTDQLYYNVLSMIYHNLPHAKSPSAVEHIPNFITAFINRGIVNIPGAVYTELYQHIPGKSSLIYDRHSILGTNGSKNSQVFRIVQNKRVYLTGPWVNIYFMNNHLLSYGIDTGSLCLYLFSLQPIPPSDPVFGCYLVHRFTDPPTMYKYGIIRLIKAYLTREYGYGKEDSKVIQNMLQDIRQKYSAPDNFNDLTLWKKRNWLLLYHPGYELIGGVQKLTGIASEWEQKAAWSVLNSSTNEYFNYQHGANLLFKDFLRLIRADENFESTLGDDYDSLFDMVKRLDSHPSDEETEDMIYNVSSKSFHQRKETVINDCYSYVYHQKSQIEIKDFDFSPYYNPVLDNQYNKNKIITTKDEFIKCLVRIAKDAKNLISPFPYLDNGHCLGISQGISERKDFSYNIETEEIEITTAEINSAEEEQ